jgi:hypothetical protein
MPITETSNDKNVAAITAENSAIISDPNDTTGIAIKGTSDQGFAGILGTGSKNGVWGLTQSPTDAGVFGQNTGSGNGIDGHSVNGYGIKGDTENGVAGIFGAGAKNGVWGWTESATDAGVFGQNQGSGNGLYGHSINGYGIKGDTENGDAGIFGAGVKNGVWGWTESASDAGVFGQNNSAGNGVVGTSISGVGVWGKGGHLAGKFDGDVEIGGNLTILNGKDIHLADFAEEFDSADSKPMESGTVVVLDNDGSVLESSHEYDHKVAGVIVGGGNFRSAIILDKDPKKANRITVALMGKVYCKVDARSTPVNAGDLLTSSSIPGYAMKASDPIKAFGAVIGKALQPLKHGQGLIPILIALQ